MVADIYPAREAAADHPGVSADLIVDAVNAVSAGAAVSSGGVSESAEALGSVLEDGDLCLLMGAGDIGTAAGRLVR